jgi:hypothetical protein
LGADETESEVVRSEDGLALKVFDRSAPPPSGEPSVTIHRRGVIAMNRAAAEALGSPDAIELMYDESERVVGIRPAGPGSRRGFKLGRAGKSSTREAVGKSFLNHHGIPHDTAKRYEVKKSGDLLLIDLKQGGIEVRPRGGRRRED